MVSPKTRERTSFSGSIFFLSSPSFFVCLVSLLWLHTPHKSHNLVLVLVLLILSFFFLRKTRLLVWLSSSFPFLTLVVK